MVKTSEERLLELHQLCVNEEQYSEILEWFNQTTVYSSVANIKVICYNGCVFVTEAIVNEQ